MMPRCFSVCGPPALALVALLFGSSCSSDDDLASTPDAGPADAVDVGFVDAGPPDSGEPFVSPFCEAMGLPSMRYRPPASTYAFGDVAGDFTVTELDGERWRLLDNWTGCESYVFITYYPTARGDEDELWGSGVDELVGTPLNSRFFFMSAEPDNQRPARVASMKAKVDEAIDRLYPDPTDNAARKARFHYVTDNVATVPGSVGAFWRDYFGFANSADSVVQVDADRSFGTPIPFFLAIDRDQEWDSGGNPDQAVGSPPALRMASYLPYFFNHKASIRDALAAEANVTSISLIDDTVTERIFVRQASLPPERVMTGFDTMEFDVSVNCPHRNVFACSEWDRIARIQQCLDEACEARRELVRWITPYWRRGERRWIIDASALLGLVKAGGAQSFRIVFGPSWERATSRDVRVTLRLRDAGRGERAVQAERAFTGGEFVEAYNDREPFLFTPPATASKVELVLILSGHRDAPNTRCAEWCDHRHKFAVNGTDLPEIRHEGRVGSAGGCAAAAARGVPPGQWGNWASERAYWCPGLPVDHQRIDITNQVDLGRQNELTYSAYVPGGLVQTGGGEITLTSYVVWYE